MGNSSLYRWAQITQDDHQIRYEALQTPQPYRKHVRQNQRLETRRNPLRQKPDSISLRHNARRNRYILVMCPEPKKF